MDRIGNRWQADPKVYYFVIWFDRYTVPLDNPLLKTKETPCEERQCLSYMEPYRYYVVEVQAYTPQVPYGNDFVVHSVYTLSFVSAKHSHLTTHIGKFLIIF